MVDLDSTFSTGSTGTTKGTDPHRAVAERYNPFKVKLAE
jgi:hypothetical protein